ncbi:MAG: autotransporter domain-containing protein [Burkholderiales bacterium]
MYSGYSSVTVPFETPFSWGDQNTSGAPPKINMQMGAYPNGGNPNPIQSFSLDTGSIGITVSAARPNAGSADGQYFKPGPNDILVYNNVSTYYSSSGLTETGSAYLTNVGIFDPAKNLMATAKVLVLAVTGESCNSDVDCHKAMSSSCAGVSPCDYPKYIAYSGIGFNANMAFAQSTTDLLNPFTSLVSIAGVPNAKIWQGYILSNTGVTLGLSAAATQNFAFIKLGNNATNPQPNNVTWAHPTGVLTINGVSGNAQMLFDTGVGQMYLTPAPGVVYTDQSGANALPASSKIQIAVPGMSNAYGISYNFTTGSQDNPLAPNSYFVTTKDGTVETAFVNTGRNIFQGYNYLYDATGGYVGFSWNGLLSSQFEQFAPSLTLLGTVPLSDGFASNLPTVLSQNTSLSTAGVAMLAGNIAGPGSLTLTNGTLTLAGNNTYTGGTEIAGGTLIIGSDSNLGANSGALTFSGGALQTVSTMTSARAVNLSSVAVIEPDINTTLTLSGALTGTGGILMMGDGKLALSGNNTFSGGTGVFSGTVAINGPSPLGTGPVYVAPSATLMGAGNIAGALTVAGTLKPGNSPGYLTTQSTVNMLSGSTYVQDIAGTTQASAATPAGTSGSYSYLKVSGAAFNIGSGATLAPRLQNLFSPSEHGYGSTPYTPVLGDKFRILTADGGITGRFTTVLQPAGLASGTQFIKFYNYNGSNSLDLAVVPASYNSTLASSGNKNAQSVGSALDKMVAANQTGIASIAQDQLLYGASGQSAVNLPAYALGMAGESYGATLAVVPQATQRLQQAILTRLGDSLFVPTRGAPAVTSTTNSAISATNPGGQPTASMSSNPRVNPYAASFSNGSAWGEVAYQYGNRPGDNNSGGWTSNLVQAVIGADAFSQAGIKLGGGLSLSNTNVSANQGSGNVQQGSLFLYGKMPVEQFVVDAVASYGFNTTDNSRKDVTGITTGLQAKGVKGNDALVSLGLNLPIEVEEATLSPYARVTWQQVTQNGFSEGNAASALTVNSYNGNGVRGVVGVTVGSKATNPLKESFTYRANIGVGVDSSTLLSPTLNASLAGAPFQIYTPSPGAAFVQLGLFATASFADNAYAYIGVTTEARSGQTLVGGNIGAMLLF